MTKTIFDVLVPIVLIVSGYVMWNSKVGRVLSGIGFGWTFNMLVHLGLEAWRRW